jgi:hypothetical protein
VTDDGTFERDLRTMLVGRDPGPAPAGLGRSVRARLDAEANARRRPIVARWALGLGSMAATVAIVVAIAALGLRAGSQPPTPGAFPSPAIPAFDPADAGSGIVPYQSDATWIVVAVGAVLVGMILGLRTKRRRILIGIALAVAATTVGSMRLWTTSFVGFDQGVFESGLGWVATIEQPDGTTFGPPERPQETFQVAPSGILTFGFDVHNSAVVPITILGLAPEPMFRAWGEVQAVGLLRDPERTDIHDAANTEPFHPVDVAPNERVFLIVAGRADNCALAPGSPPDPNGAGASLDRVTVAYEILGIRRVSSVELPFVIDLRMNSTCTSTR